MRSTTLLLALSLLLGPAPAWGFPVTFADFDGSCDDTAVVDLQGGSSSESVYLCLGFGTASTTSGTACDDGNGEETCGFDALVEVQGDAYIVSFVPETGVEYTTPTSSELHVVGVTAISPASGYRRIGQLTLDTTGADGGKVVFTAGEVVKANLDVFPINERMVASTPLPEPGEMLLLVSGILGLAALYRLRSRSAPSA